MEKMKLNVQEEMSLLTDEQLIEKFREAQDGYDTRDQDSEIYAIRSAAIEEIGRRIADNEQKTLEFELAGKISDAELKEYMSLDEEKKRTKLAEYKLKGIFEN